MAREESILASPVRLIATVNGQETHWRKGTLKRVAHEHGMTILSQAFSSAKLRVNTVTQIDFDGMIRFDCALSAPRPVVLDALTLEIPVRARHAKYFYHFPGQWYSASNVGALPAQGLTLPFRPFVWLGDEERGLCWFTESDLNWFKSDPNGVIEVAPEDDVVTLRAHLVSTPVRLVPVGTSDVEMTGFGQKASYRAAVRELRYTFGLQATPVKPVEQDAWDQRIVCINHSTAGFRQRLRVAPSLLDKLRDAGVRTVVIFEYWTDAEGHPKTPHGAQLKELVRACHDRGLKVLLYFSFLISDLAPEWRDFGKDSVILPKGGYPVFHYLPQPEQSAWRVCLRSTWQDRLVSGMAEALRDFDADGVYLDGTEYPFGCSNTEHGCGAVHPDGSITPTYPIFGVRSAMRRIYNVVRSHRPNGQVNIHNSTCMTIPTLGWGTCYWDGEQFGQFPPKAGKVDPVKLLPLDAFRAEFMGHQWGVPAEFLCYGKPFTFEQAWSFTLLHDVPVRPLSLGTFEQLRLASSVWKTMEEFGRKEAEWLPYWRNAKYVKTSPESAYVSLYRHRKNGVLAVISNFAGESAEVNVQFDLDGLGLAGRLVSAEDAIIRQPIAIRKGKISLTLPKLGWKLVMISFIADASVSS